MQIWRDQLPTQLQHGNSVYSCDRSQVETIINKHKEFQATLNILHIPTPNEVSYSSIIFFSKAQHAISTHESYKWACYEWKFWLSFPFQADNFDYILSVIGWRWPFLGFPWKRGTPISCYLNQCKMSFYTSSNKNLCNICF